MAIVLVAIVAIGLVAATISSPIDPGSEGLGPNDGDGDGEIGPQPVEHGETTTIPSFFIYLIYAMGILVAIAIVWYLIYYRRDAVKALALVIATAAILVGILYLLLELGVDLPTEEQQNQTVESPGDGEPGGGDGGDGEEDIVTRELGPFLGFLVVLAMIFVGGLLLSARSSSTDEKLPTESTDAQPDEQAAVAAAAGRAANRISADSTEDVDNEVYRAWREMTQLLEVDRPETTTPGEFATAATEAGLEREHVDELTRLFEDVRYGHEATTAEREERAVTILRAIESAYGGGDDE